MWRLRKPVLALGGGGARGFAHLGVLDVLDRLGLGVRGVAGTSMGAVIGAMYLCHGSAAATIERWRSAFEEELIPPVRPLRRTPKDEVREHPLLQAARRIRDQIVIAFAVNRSTILDDVDLVKAFDFLIPDISVASLPKPFVAVAVDLETGDEVRLRSGDLRPVLKASSAIPGVLPAVELEGRRLVDGGILAEVPVAAAREMGWPVVAVDVAMEIPPLGDDDTVLDTMMRTQMMTSRLVRRRQLERATMVIRPDVGCTTWADWSRFEDLIEVGRVAAAEYLGL